jgi:DNA invertase Pin-like site-specific DNA recombinase
MADRSAAGAIRAPAKLRCAIYTRKSSEEGLEQDFNSLDAQREACEAFIASQKREGWSPVGATMTMVAFRAVQWNGRPAGGF